MTEEKINDWLCSLGYLFPINDIQEKRFEKLYEDYDFILNQNMIDLDNITNNSYKCKSYSPKLNIVNSKEISELRMVARKGSKEISNDVINKMKSKHRKSNDGNET